MAEHNDFSKFLGDMEYIYARKAMINPFLQFLTEFWVDSERNTRSMRRHLLRVALEHYVTQGVGSSPGLFLHPELETLLGLKRVTARGSLDIRLVPIHPTAEADVQTVITILQAQNSQKTESPSLFFEHYSIHNQYKRQLKEPQTKLLISDASGMSEHNVQVTFRRPTRRTQDPMIRGIRSLTLSPLYPAHEKHSTLHTLTTRNRENPD